MSAKEKNIANAVALKGTIDLFVAGILEFETDDVAAELFAIADPIAAGLIDRSEPEGRSSNSSNGSRRRGSSSSGSGRQASSNRAPSSKQIAWATDLIEQTGADYDVDDLPNMSSKEVSDIISELK